MEPEDQRRDVPTQGCMTRQLGSWVRSLRTDVSRGYVTVSSRRLISDSTYQLITLALSAMLAVHSRQSLQAWTFLCPFFQAKLIPEIE